MQHVVNGHTFYAPDNDHIGKYLALGVYYEADLLAAIKALKLAPGVYIDGGACLGTHSVFFAKECGATMVVAVEPNPEALRYLRYNVNGLPVAVLNMCLSDGLYCTVDKGPSGNLGTATTRAVQLHAGSDAGITVIDAQGGSSRSQVGSDDLKVECTTIDALGEYSRISLIKLDIEGKEVEALRGARRTIAIHKPVIVTEAHTDADLLAIGNILQGQWGYLRSRRYCKTPTYIWVHSDTSFALSKSLGLEA